MSGVTLNFQRVVQIKIFSQALQFFFTSVLFIPGLVPRSATTNSLYPLSLSTTHRAFYLSHTHWGVEAKRTRGVYATKPAIYVGQKFIGSISAIFKPTPVSVCMSEYRIYEYRGICIKKLVQVQWEQLEGGIFEFQFNDFFCYFIW